MLTGTVLGKRRIDFRSGWCDGEFKWMWRHSDAVTLHDYNEIVNKNCTFLKKRDTASQQTFHWDVGQTGWKTGRPGENGMGGNPKEKQGAKMEQE